MKKLDISNWREFKIGDLFEKLDLKVLKKNFNKRLDVEKEKTDEHSLPLVNACHFNNGIMFYGRPEDFESAEMTLDIVQNGAIATGDVFSQPQRTGVLWDAYLIKPKSKIASSATLNFLATVIQKSIKQKFAWNDKCIWQKVKEMTIFLPATSDGSPDWTFMEYYEKKLEAKVSERLTQFEKEKLRQTKINIKNWKKFKIGNLFNVVKGTRLTRKNMVWGNINYIGASAANNGITKNIKNSECLHAPNKITVSYNGSVGEAFYQREKFWASDDVNVLYPKFDLTENIALFICPILKKVGQNYAFIEKWTKENMENDEIFLPAAADGSPDWAFMENYIGEVKNAAESRLAKLEIGM